MLRLIVNKAKHHYNRGLELAERETNDDAIQELKNALDLDSSLINAHVVLGSLYARREMLDEAQACWEKALGKDYRYLKAHEYLDKAKQVKLVFPAVRGQEQVNQRLKKILFVMVILAVLLAVALAIPRSHPPYADDVLTKLPIQDFSSAESRSLLKDAYKSDSLTDSTKLLAMNLHQDMDQHWDDWLRIADLAVQENQPDLALEIVGILEKKSPDTSENKRLESLRSRSADILSDKLLAMGRQYFNGQVEYETFMTRATKFLGKFPGNAAHQAIRGLKDKISKHYLDNLVTTAKSGILKGPLADAVRLAADLQNRHPEHADQIIALLDQRLSTEADRLSYRTLRLVEEGRFEESEDNINSLILLYQSAGRPEPSEKTGIIRQAIRDTRELLREEKLKVRLQEIRAMFDEAQWGRFIENTESIDSLTDDEAEREQLETMRAEALETHAVKTAEWFQELDPKFESMRLSVDEAARAIHEHDKVPPHLPDNLNYMRGAILYYTACAYLKLEKPGNANDILNQLDSLGSGEYPGYIRAAVKAFRKEYADQLGLDTVDLDDTNEDLGGEFKGEAPEESRNDPGKDNNS